MYDAKPGQPVSNLAIDDAKKAGALLTYVAQRMWDPKYPENLSGLKAMI